MRSGASPTASKAARITTHRKLVYPSTRSNPVEDEPEAVRQVAGVAERDERVVGEKV